MFSSWILRNVSILLEDFSNLVCSVKFQISQKRRTNTTFHGIQNPQPKVFQQKIQVLVLLLPVAIVSPYAAWKAWQPKFEPIASPPKIEFKSIEVPSSSLAFLAVLCFVFLVLEVFRCCSNFLFSNLRISPFFGRSDFCEWSILSSFDRSHVHQVKNPMQNFVEGFSSLVVERLSKNFMV